MPSRSLANFAEKQLLHPRYPFQLASGRASQGAPGTVNLGDHSHE